MFVLAWGALHAFIVPRIGELRPRLEAQLSRSLGIAVKIGEVDAQSSGLNSELSLRNVVLHDSLGRPALSLPSIRALVSPRSVLELGFDQLVIDAPVLDIRRTAHGRIEVAGLEVSGSADRPGDSRAANWFFSQDEFAVTNGVVRWTDEWRNQPTLVLSRVNFVTRNRGSSHDLLLSAAPPSAWGTPFQLMGKFRAPLFGTEPSDWKRWQGQAHASFAGVDVAKLNDLVPTGVVIRAGQGAMRAWLELEQGELTQVTVDVALADAQAQLAIDLPPLKLNQLAGRLQGVQRAGSGQFSTQGLSFSTADGVNWPKGDLTLRWQTDGAGKASAGVASAAAGLGAWAVADEPNAKGEFSADALDLGALTQLSGLLPLGTATQAQLADLALGGKLFDVSGSWAGALSQPREYSVKGRAEGLSLRAAVERQASYTTVGTDSVPVLATYTVPGRPGFRELSAEFEANQAGGKAKLGMTKGELSLPGVFEEPKVAIDSLSTLAQWRMDANPAQVQPAKPATTARRVEVVLDKLKVSNLHLAADARVKWQTSDPAKSRGKSTMPGVIDLQGSFSRVDAGQVWRYLPQAIAKPARDYVRDALLAGTANNMAFNIKGDLFNMPFERPEDGTFRIAGPVTGVKFAYVPKSLAQSSGLPWPAFTQLNGNLSFVQTALQLTGMQARFEGQPGLVVKADARVPNLTNNLQVNVNGEVRGPVSEVLGVINGSPLLEITNKSLLRAVGSGPADLRLRMQLPVFNLANSKVQGSVTLVGNDVQVTPEAPKLMNAKGVVTFSEAGFAIAQARALVLGGEVRLEGGMQRVNAQGQGIAANAPAAPGQDTAVVIRAQGSASAEGLRNDTKLGFLSRIAANATGQANYDALIRIRRGVVESQVKSDLRGMALRLPPPLDKAADTELALRFDNTLLAQSLIDNNLADQLKLELGGVASLHYERSLNGDNPRVLRGAIGVGVAPGAVPTLGVEGVQANIDFSRLNLDAWELVLSRVSAGGLGGEPVRGSGAQGYLPTVMAIRAQELTVGGRTLNNIVIGGAREGQLWRANLDASELSGYVEYRQPSGQGAGRVYARLARLSIAAAAAKEVEELLDRQPASIPALDIVVEDFELKGRRLGRFEAEAINRGANIVAREGGLREWRLTKLLLQMPEATLSAQGNWAAMGAQAPLMAGSRAGLGLQTSRAEQRRTVMNLRLELRDSGELLKRFGLVDVIRGGKGLVAGQVAWVGSPFTPDYPTMTGQLNLNVESGQFLKAEPGIAKLFGVLSLQSLPRRLSLDFRDVFTEGFAFDFIRGDSAITAGVASTNNLQMKGVNAAVLIEGSADIAKETQDLLVRVVPEINAGTASLIATAINPAIGLGTFLAQLVLRRPLILATTQSFEIKGTWVDPKINKAESKVASADAPATAASEVSR